MDQTKITILHSLFGDASDIKDKLDYVLKNATRQDVQNDEILYHLRSIVAKCDMISNTIEKEFK